MKWMIHICLIVCSACFQLEVSAQDTVAVEEPVEYNEENYDESTTNDQSEKKYTREYMDEYKLESMRKKKEFQYPDLDSLDDLDEELTKSRPATTKKNRFEGFDANILVWLVVAVAIVVIILQLLGMNMRQLFTPGKRKGVADSGDLLSENIHDIPYESSIQQAIAAKNYSLATRLLYLQSLKMLFDKQLILWHENKTNWQYVFELKNEKLRNSFRVITHIFEYVQYGHMPITEQKFVAVQESFRNFKSNIA